MEILRAFLRDHCRLAALLLTAVLCLKALVPAGYMVEQRETVLTIRICSETTGEHLIRQIAVPMKNEPAGQHGETEAACPWSALSTGGLAGADPVLLALAVAFILALGIASHSIPALRRIAHLRPPMRAPPLTG